MFLGGRMVEIWRPYCVAGTVVLAVVKGNWKDVARNYGTDTTGTTSPQRIGHIRPTLAPEDLS